MRIFQTSRVAAAVLLATGLSLPCIGMADVGSARAPVWTEALGEVQLDQYTPEERAQMVRDYWTAERIRTAIPVDIALPEDSVRTLIVDTDTDAGSSPQQPYDPDFWTQERLCDALRNAIPLELLAPDGSVRALLTEAAAAAGGSSPTVVHEEGYWTPERIRTAIPVKMFGPDADGSVPAPLQTGAGAALIALPSGAEVLGEPVASSAEAPELPSARSCVITPVEVPSPEGTVRAWLVTDDVAGAQDGGSSPDSPMKRDFGHRNASVRPFRCAYRSHQTVR